MKALYFLNNNSFEYMFLADKTRELNARLQLERVFLPVNKPGRVTGNCFLTMLFVLQCLQKCI